MIYRKDRKAQIDKLHKKPKSPKGQIDKLHKKDKKDPKKQVDKEPPINSIKKKRDNSHQSVSYLFYVIVIFRSLVYFLLAL